MRFICAIYGSFYDFSCILNLYDGFACVCTRDASEIKADSIFSRAPFEKNADICICKTKRMAASRYTT